MKDVKTKPKTTKRKQYKLKQSFSARTPKTAQSSQIAARTTVPRSTVDTLKRQYAQKKAELQKQTSEQYEKPENYAVDKVEDRAETSVYTAADVIARTGKNIKENIRQRGTQRDIPPMPNIMKGADTPQQTQHSRINQPKTAELPEAKPKPQEQAKVKMRREAAVKAKEQRTAAQANTKSMIKTKEEYLNINQSPSVKENPKAIKTKESVFHSSEKSAAESPKIKTRQAVSEQKQIAPKSEIKTKESVLAHSNSVKAESAKPMPKSAPVREAAPTAESLPKSTEPPMKIKTKDEYLKLKSEPMQNMPDSSCKLKPPFQAKPLPTVWVKEAEQKQMSVDKTQIARRKYVQNKLKAQSEAAKNTIPPSESQTILMPDVGYSPEAATVPDMMISADSSAIPKQKPTLEKLIKTKKTDIKTRGSSIRSHNGMNIKARPAELDSPHIITADKRSIKSKPKGITNIVRNKTEHIKASISKPTRAVKTANRSIKSAKTAAKKKEQQFARKAAKQAAVRARDAAKKSAQAVKAGVQYAVRAAKAIASAALGIARAALSAISAMGGIAVLVTVLIIVIIIAAIAASPFGIFFSEEANDVGTIPLSQIIAEYNVELTQEVEDIELSVPHTDVNVTDNQTNTNVVIAVFAAKTAGTEDNTATDVVVFDAEKAEKLKEFFRAANIVEYTVEPYGDTGSRLNITITGKTKEELMDCFELTDKQREAVETLLEHGDVLTSSSHSLAVTDANVQAIIEGLPASLPQKRKDVVKNAASLVGKVNYFWGGKSSAIGWDSAWGTMQRVTAAGSPSSGTIRAYGLDCSGFVTWAFNNSGMGYAVGHGTYGQRDASIQVSESTVQAGDLCFLSSYSHVGIVVGKNTDGNILVIHCSSSANNVVLSTAASVGFTVFRRPLCY